MHVASRGRRPFLRRVVAALLGLVTVVGLATPAAADELDETMVARYELRPDVGSVAVTLTLTITNNVPDEYLANGVRYYYLDRFSTPIHRGATAVRATSGGRPLAIDVVPVAESRFFDRLVLDLAAPLYSGETQELVVSYDLPGGAPRSDSAVRANPAYVSFPAFGAGDAGQVSIELTVPADFALEAEGFRPIGTADATVTYSSGPIGLEGLIEVRLVAARADTRLLADQFEAAGEEVLVRSWPGDPAWAAFAQEVVGRGLPELQRLVGLPWPVEGPLEVLQTDSASLNGYDGRYNSSTDVVEVDEDLDAHVMVHELAHAWFNRDLFGSIWINEGLAETYAERTLAALGIEDRVRASQPDRSSPYAVPLDRWRRPDLDDPDGDEKELWSYGAAHWVVDQLVAEIGTDAMSTVLARASDDVMAYLGDDPSQQTNRPPDWRRLLDLLEEVGGSTEATALFEQWVVAPDDLDELEGRAEAREAYRALVADSDGWTVPLAVRRALDDWAFDDVAPLVTAARGVLAQRAELAAVLDPLGLPMPATVEETYEAAAGDFDTAARVAAEHLDEARRVAAAVARADAPVGVWDRIGLWGADLPGRRAAVLDAYRAGADVAVEAALADLDGVLDGAERRGKQRAGLAGAGLVGMVTLTGIVVVLAVRVQRRQPVPVVGSGGFGPTGTAPTGGPAGAGAPRPHDLYETEREPMDSSDP